MTSSSPSPRRAKKTTSRAVGGAARAKKLFVLDTNVVLHDPESIFAFEGARVVIPLPVIEELDTFKRLYSSVAAIVIKKANKVLELEV